MPRALIVEDEPAVRTALKRWFEKQGYLALEAADGEQARALLAAPDSDAPDVIICDMHLPGISGEILLALLSVERPELAARVILTTGDSVDHAAPGSVLATHAFVLQKPFELSELKSMVERVLRTD